MRKNLEASKNPEASNSVSGQNDLPNFCAVRIFISPIILGYHIPIFDSASLNTNHHPIFTFVPHPTQSHKTDKRSTTSNKSRTSAAAAAVHFMHKFVLCFNSLLLNFF